MNSNIFGSMLIIAGTTIGAGMLALPLASAGLGFPTAITIMILIWALMSYTALLMIEVHQHAPTDATLHSLALKLLGRKGQIVASGAMIFLFYALCAAYIAGGGEQLSSRLIDDMGFNVPAQTGAIIFTLLIGSIVCIGTHSVDLINRGLFILKLIALVLMLGFMFPHVQTVHLLEMPMEQGLIIAALPVIFTSFGFHGSIPSIVKYLGKDTKVLRKVMLVGSSLPLIVYILWQIASQGTLSQQSLLASGSLKGFIDNLGFMLDNPYIAKTVSTFADLALATSFLGVSLGLFDFVSDFLHQKSKGIGSRINSAVVTFIPPLGFALFYPQGFIMALGYAAIALVILAIFLPVAMVISQRKQLNAESGYQVAGGNIALILATAAGVVIISSQILQMLGLLPTI